MAVNDGEATVGTAWKALGVRGAELARVRALFIASFLVGLALVSFFSASNALFLDDVGADRLAWVYLSNAPLVVAAGLGYSAWSRRSPTATVLAWSIRLLVISVTLLWLWAALAPGPAASFALAVWFRFLFVFGLLGLWEVASAVFDVRQAKRLFPAVALGAMLAFMVGGALVSLVASLVGTTQLIAVSAGCFLLYALAFERAADGADFDAADATEPATPRQIMSHRFSRNLALMRSITILLIFVTEFIFYGQVEANIDGDESIARFLGIFLAGATLAMVVVTAVLSARYISRFGVGTALATMPAGLLLAAVALVLWGTLVGIDRGFFVIAVVANVLNMVLANAIETPVGAVMYQPMPPERRMPVRVAVDGWLGSVALLVVGLLLLAFDALDLDGELPFAWLLGAIGVAGMLLARTLHRDYREALGEATTLAFHRPGAGRDLLGELEEGQGLVHAGVVGDDPAALFALTSLAAEVGDQGLDHVIPDLLVHPDDDVASVAIAAAAADGGAVHASRLHAIVVDDSRSPRRRAEALDALHELDADSATRLADRLDRVTDPHDSPLDDALQVQVAALRLGSDPVVANEIADQAASADPDQRFRAARVLAACPLASELPEAATAAVADLLVDPDPSIAATVIPAAHGRIDPEVAQRLVDAGHSIERRRACVAALASGGEVAVASIERVIDRLPEPYLIELVDGVYATSTRRPKLLHRFLEPALPSSIRRAGFDAARRADVDLPATVRRMASDDVDWARRLVAAHHLVDAEPTRATSELVRHILADEFASVRSTIWAALRTRGHADRLDELESFAARSDTEDRANAIESLDALLDRPTRDLVVPVLEPFDLAEAAELLDTSTLDPPVESLAALSTDTRLADTSRRLLAHHLDPQENAMSDTLERVLALKRIDIFSTLSYALLVELADVAEVRLADAGRVVIEEGTIGDELFALVSGEVAISGSEVRLAAGSVFGELAVLAPGPRTATVTTVTESSMLVLDRETLLSLTERRPSVMAEIARVLAERLQTTVRREAVL